MTRYITPHDAAQVWIDTGGPKNRVVAWVSVAYSESSLDLDAESPVGARGLYQIMPFNFIPLGLDPTKWQNPYINTEAAVRLSGTGMNFAPWDTAYADIGASGRYRYLAWPERGSAAWSHMAYIAGLIGLGNSGFLNPPAEPLITGSLPAALSWYSQATHVVLPRFTARTRNLTVRARTAYTR